MDFIILNPKLCNFGTPNRAEVQSNIAGSGPQYYSRLRSGWLICWVHGVSWILAKVRVFIIIRTSTTKSTHSWLKVSIFQNLLGAAGSSVHPFGWFTGLEHQFPSFRTCHASSFEEEPAKTEGSAPRDRQRGRGCTRITLFSLVGHFSVAKFGSMYILNIENFHCMFLDVSRVINFTDRLCCG